MRRIARSRRRRSRVRACLRRSAGARPPCGRPRRACRCRAPCRAPAGSSSRCSSRPTGCRALPSAGARSAKAASARSVQATLGWKPWMTAAGASSADRVTRKPCASTTDVSPSPPTTRIVEPAGTSSSSSTIAACGDVTTSSPTTVRPSSDRCSATESAVRDALLVIYPTRMRLLRAIDALNGIWEGVRSRRRRPRRGRRAADRRPASGVVSVGAHGIRILALLHDLDDVAAVGIRRAGERVAGPLGPREPLRGLVVAAQLFEHRRVRVEERGAPVERALRVELRDLQLGQRRLRLTEIESRAGHRDRQGDLHRHVELGRAERNARARAPDRRGRRRARCRPSAAAGRCCR